MIDEIEALARRFPQHAATIRLLQARDPSFRSICEDYAEARRALKHWEAAGQTAPGRAAEYREIVKELEAEALKAMQSLRDS